MFLENANCDNKRMLLSFSLFFLLAHGFCSSLLNLLDQNEFDSEDDFLRKYGDIKAAEQVIPSLHVSWLAEEFEFQYGLTCSVS